MFREVLIDANYDSHRTTFELVTTALSGIVSLRQITFVEAYVEERDDCRVYGSGLHRR